MGKRRYDDKFRSNAIVLLEAAGYPERDGALSQVAKHLKMPTNTLHGWANAIHNPPPDDVVDEQRKELKELLEDELSNALAAMGNVRGDATYRDLGVVVGILTDKMQLISGNATQNVKQAITFERTGISTIPQHLTPSAIESADGEEEV